MSEYLRDWISLASLRLAAGSLAMAVALAPNAAIAQKKGNGDQVTYVFRTGDTLFDLASKYLRKRSDYVTVQRLNRIANPRAIPVGKTITIPFRLLKYRPSEANLSAFRGNITIASDGRNLTPVRGLDISEGSRLQTAARSFLTLQLEDGSRVSLPSNSNVRITRLRRILLTDSVDYEIAVDNGRIRSQVAPLKKKADRYRVRTPVAVSAVRGTDYRTRVDEASGTAFSETVEGEVVVAAGESLKSSAMVSVPAGTGAAASTSGAIDTAELLNPPELLEPAKVQSEEMLQFALAPNSNAIGHRIVIASDAGYVDIMAEAEEADSTIEFADIPNGRYFVKASALASDGFEGMPASYSFKRQLSTLGGSADAGDFGFRFKWFGAGEGNRYYRLQILKGSKTATPMIDETGLSLDTVTLSDLEDGDYYWRVGVIQFSSDPEDREAIEKWTDFEKLTVAN